MDMLANLALGLQTAFTPVNLLYCFLGVFLGTFIGVLPGIGSLAAVSMLLPITFYIEPTTALVMLAGVYYGAEYGGSTASILLNLPGTPSSAVTCLDGYPMAQKGRAGVALFITTIASFVGGSIGILLLMAFSPLLSQVALAFGPAEYFALMALGLIAAAGVTQNSPLKGIAMVVLGLVLGSVGADVNTGITRYTFGLIELYDGISLVALAMGLFGVAEIIASIRDGDRKLMSDKITLRSMLPAKGEGRQVALPILRGAGIGSFFGALPGAGQSIASFIGYAVEKKVAKDPSRFGKGAIEGLASPESANNAAVQTAFIPTLTLGIPGSATMALMLGALLIHGITPGPGLMANNPDIFWGLVMSFWIGNIMLLILNIPLIGIWVRLLKIPYQYLYPAILVLICIGVYALNYSLFEVGMVLGFGALGYAMRLLRFEPAPLLIGFVLGPMMEENLRRAMLLARGDPMVLVSRPISGTLLAITLVLLAFMLVSVFRRKRVPLVQ
ncbi:tripartite tricarboxylate transporter permease [Pelagibacterium halotolerans]|uniref:Tricarboxylate transport membrane protein TctA n=1 Tax=Pelagibacterium halotolerans (strain DSM 22347 / JCM 15775 / CGMCC 1.7692 / B2) TaxID=1082931 RepID=G4R8D0_PELHB|nr:tripartite tricarboxylate transporter permease [Pelagibacterium halotolerans]AEQ52374.1 tricarboxylate transport membrane protein TctA [Pelagibacterium halotolerans B2]QJR17887.1 tripartite tricarboxylate transporter permease [Pelagibacterium halotolerans]SEA34662.1 TctA family transporter [Pelagibacterium halotolerans]